MGHITHLPTELLDLIMHHVAATAASQDSGPRRDLFPFNVASVCALWLDVLISRPQHWRRIVIDVADDPTPFLDTFALFNNPDMDQEIIIFSSLVYGTDAGHGHDDNRGAEKWRENSRVRKIFEHLEPSLARFSDITFDLVYQSSLPSATKFLVCDLPRLKTLSLECTVYDFDDEDGEITTDDAPFSPLTVALLSLRQLCLTGLAFMELYQLGLDWVIRFKDRLSSGLELFVTHFQFHEPGRGNHNNSRTVENLLQLLCNTRSMLNTIYLHDFSLNYQPTSGQESESQHELLTFFFTCEEVSRDFLTALFCSVTFGPEYGSDTVFTFKSCSIPDINFSPAFPLALVLQDLPHQTLGFQYPLNTSDSSDNSVINALSAFMCCDVTIKNCDGVTDELLDWLTERIMSEECHPLDSLHICNCTKFTSGGLRAFVQNQDRAFSGQSGLLDNIFIAGAGPPLSEEDNEWFLDEEKHNNIRIYWDL